MTQYIILNIKLSNLQFYKLNSEIKNGIELTRNLSSNEFGNFNDETNFLYKSLLTDTQILSICKGFCKYFQIVYQLT